MTISWHLHQHNKCTHIFDYERIETTCISHEYAMKGAQPSPFINVCIGTLLASGVHKLYMYVCSQSSLNKFEKWPLLLASILVRVVGKGGHTGSVSDSDTWTGVRQGSSWLTQFHYQTLQMVAEPVLIGGRGKREEIKKIRHVLYDSYIHIHLYLHVYLATTVAVSTLQSACSKQFT